MKYETPELTALTPAINAIQEGGPSKTSYPSTDNILPEDVAAYTDWED